MAEPPGERVYVPMMYWEAELTVTGFEVRVRMGGGGE